MPTGYTAGILDGRINTFEEFAKACAKAFGGMSHMRHSETTDEYIPDKINDYYTDSIDKCNRKLVELANKSNEDLENEALVEYNDDKEHNLKQIVRVNNDREKLTKFLQSAKDYIPPTEDHEDIKNFMIQQLTDTIVSDCNTEYHDQQLIRNHQLIKDLPNRNLRLEKLEVINTSLGYNIKRFKDETTRIDENNEWVRVLFKSIKNLD